MEPEPSATDDIGERLAGTASDVRDRVARLDANAKVAWIGALLATFAFLLLPYTGKSGTAVELGGRFWWRPILAIAAAILVTMTTRRVTAAHPLGIAAVATASAAATESGLLGLVSSSSRDLRIGFYMVLLGAVLTLVAAIRAALRSTR